MKTTRVTFPIIFLGMYICLSGCATSTVTRGRDFDSSKVSQIVKGKTTADEILGMFGAPKAKAPQGDDGEHWIYSYVTATAEAHAVPGGGVHSEITGGHKKILNLIFKDGIVVNYTFEDEPIEPQTQDTHRY